MRWIAVVVALVVACHGSEQGERVPGQLTVKAKGLYLGPNELGETPDGALTRADNVVISRDGIVETRRGQEVVGAKALSRVVPFKGAIVGHSGSTLSHSDDSGATWTDYAAAVTPPAGHPMRSAEVSGNLFVTSGEGLKRLDGISSEPVAAGVPPALDLDLSLSTATGTALPTANQVGYRVVFGAKDANGRLLLGSPSARATIANTSGAIKDVTAVFSLPRGLSSSHFFQLYRSVTSGGSTIEPNDELGLVYEGPVPANASITQLSRTTNVVTATTSAAHGYVTGQIVRVGPGASSGGFAAIGESVAANSADGLTWTARTNGQNLYAVAWNGSVYAAVGAGAATSPDGVTWTSRTMASGTYYAVTWTGSNFVAVGVSGVGVACAATSPDGITWTARSMVSGEWYGIAWNGSQVVAVGCASGSTAPKAATSPDGITWTTRSMPGPSATTYIGVAWSGSVFAAVANGVAASSPDGVTWTQRTIPSGDYKSIAWSGSVFAAVGGSGAAASSADGFTWTDRTIPAGTYYATGWNGTRFVAVGNNAAAASSDGITWTPQSIPAAAGFYVAVASGAGGLAFGAGEKTITGTPSGTSFTYAETGSDGSLSQAQSATPLTGAVVDSVPDGFIGAALYTNANTGEGISSANERPLVARDIAVFRETLFEANVTAPAYGVIYLLAVGGTNGLVDGDTVTINGLAYTAGAAESISGRTFKRYASGTIAQNIRDTAASLIRVVNRSLSAGVTVRDVSDPEGVPGQLAFQAADATSPLTVALSRTTAFSPTSLNVQPKTYKNGIVWSKQNQPDHLAQALALVPQKLGSDDKEILRILPTRSSLFVFKEDGIWRGTGDAGIWDWAPFDPTIRVIAPESVVVLDNTIFALTEQGVVRVSDTGVAVLSRPIEPALQAFAAPSMKATTKAAAFGVGYESDRKYLLWLPSQVGDTQGKHAYVFDHFTQAWTHRTDAASHAAVNPADDRLYTVDGASVTQERKGFGATDLSDRSYAITINSVAGNVLTLASAANVAVGDYVARGVAGSLVTSVAGNAVTVESGAGFTSGAGTVEKAIETVVQWSPRFGASPALLSEFQEVVVFWDEVYFATASLGFSTNIVPAAQSITVRGSDYGWSGTQRQAQILAWPPADMAWGSQLNVSVTHKQARSPNSIAGLAVSYTTESRAVGR